MTETKPSARSRLALAVIATSALYWAFVLFSDLHFRAFDPSDPMEQLYYANRSTEAFRQYGWRAWMSAVLSDPLAKPGTNALLSLGSILGLPESHIGYKVTTGLAVLALVCAVEGTVFFVFGTEALALFAALSAGSNIILSQAFYGGHSWFGQLFFWLSILTLYSQGWTQCLRSRLYSFFLGLLLSLSILTSYHMIPFVASLLLCFGGIYFRDGKRDHLRQWQAPAAVVAGLVSIILIFEVCTIGMPKTHYWTILSFYLSKTAGVDPMYKAKADYFFRFLVLGESKLFLLFVLVAGTFGVIGLADRRKRKIQDWFVFGILPLAAYCALEIPVVQTGRLYLPLLPFLLLLPASGFTHLLDRIKKDKIRIRVLALTAACVFLAGHSYRAETWGDFFAGKKIAASLRPARSERLGAPDTSTPNFILPVDKLIVVGRSIPYMYLPDREIRVQRMGELRDALAAGARWVLISPLSNWFWQDFLTGDAFDIPVRKIFQSDAPFTPLPGVESSNFQIFTNEAMYYKINHGDIRFPVENRLYHASDFLKACGSGLPAK